MDFSYTPEQEQFRGKVRGFLEKTSAEIFGRSEAMGASTASLLDVRDDDAWNKMKQYHRALYDAGLVALHWPKEWGGGGADLVEQSIYQDEVLRMGLPLYGANQLAIDRIGPTIMLMGNDEQKKKYLKPMLTGEEIWCQGYSEPNAGSDLAGLQTRAVLDGDSFVVNGQKVWTSLAQRAHAGGVAGQSSAAAAAFDRAARFIRFSYLLRRFEQSFDPEGFEQVAMTGSREGVDVAVIARDENDPAPAIGGMPRQRYAVLGAGQADIDDDDVEPLRGECRPHALSIACHGNLISLVDEHASQ